MTYLIKPIFNFELDSIILMSFIFVGMGWEVVCVFSLRRGHYDKFNIGQINRRELSDAIWKNFFQGKLTFLHWNKGEEMAPTIAAEGGNLLVRKLPFPAPTQVFVGDVVMLKDPEKPDDYLVRRLAAIEGYEMASKDEKEEPFVLEKDQCWVISDNEALKPKVAA
ncbi:hypothetical protein J5N97_028858 [Dioscorea zingiberensis]|uniref:Mitochondrial inner membrane protease subunit 2 n=1 Tax=Dioscorea zingiberensis TaxID=325984 RepID=A0A9D5H565_9LILI|nr:hypothetical protein J5N97_028858 [Dioscorea zingiberensis]